MLPVVENLESLTVPERKLLNAIRSGEPCNFPGDDDADQSEVDKTDWGDDRRIRAAVLKAILSGDGEAWGIGAGAWIDLGGAVVSGRLTGFDGSQLPWIRLESCRFDDGVDFAGATFTSLAEFFDATFTGDTAFRGATFTGDALFSNATFTGDTEFDEATFAGRALFGGATFTGDAFFSHATFTGDADFAEAAFTGDAGFRGATFTGDAVFDGATFTGRAFLGDATFTGEAAFRGAAFTGDAGFDGATFAGLAAFDRALAHRLSFTSAVFSAPDPGPWNASTVSLDRAVLAVRSRISITATEIDASWLQAREGAHLVLYCPRVDLSDSEFLRRSIVSSPAFAEEIPARNTPEPPSGDSPRERARAEAAAAAKELRDKLEKKLAEVPPRCRVTSLTRANIGELVLSDVVLDNCAFARAHGLDKLRIGPGCSFQPTPRRLGWRLLGRRRIIAEELRWRQAHTGGAKPGRADFLFLPAPEIAEIYRDLRKGLEEAKNEPGAADFYYGEMEMRRLAGRKPTGGTAASRRGAPSWAERALLYGYWAFSGYGLRASRALTTFAVVIAAAAFLYTHSFFATATPQAPQIAAVNLTTGAVSYNQSCQSAAPGFNPTTGVASYKQRCPPTGFWTALDYSARESISLLQVRSTPTLDTTAAGTLLDFFLRLAGPVLLAFTVLALRARIKR
ncbi:MAG: hypothetical protein JWR32_2218 [Mycobacterium sp.]|jgi:hypothetical protein|nr:hypothetical protein [Mycobacterium sp.]